VLDKRVVLSQVQGLEDVAVLSSLGTLGMLVSVGVAVGKLVVMDAPIKPTELIHRPTNITTSVVALLDIVFTYGGQVCRYLGPPPPLAPSSASLSSPITCFP